MNVLGMFVKFPGGRVWHVVTLDKGRLIGARCGARHLALGAGETGRQFVKNPGTVCKRCAPTEPR